MPVLQYAVHHTLSAADFLGLNQRLRRLNRGRLAVLAYHGVVPDEYAGQPQLYANVVGASEFARQMAILARFYHPIAVADLRDWWSGARSLPSNPVLVTFDDGYRNNLAQAAPVLQRLGIPALINVCTGYIGRQAVLWPDEVFWRVVKWPRQIILLPSGEPARCGAAGSARRLCLAVRIQEACKRISPARVTGYLETLRECGAPDLPDEVYGFLSWEDVRCLKARGFEIGSHTVGHPILTRTPVADAARELRDSRNDVERTLGCSCDCLAYPNGGAADWSPEIAEQARVAGYRFAFTLTGALVSPGDNALALDRVYIPGCISPGEFQSRVSGFYEMLKGAWHRLNEN